MVEWCGGACNVIGGGVVGGKWRSGWWQRVEYKRTPCMMLPLNFT